MRRKYVITEHRCCLELRMLKVFRPLALFMMLTTSTYTLADEQAIIVFDGSGSMWGQIDGKPKHELAREALRNMLENTPDSMALGLMAYGHREKGSCTDIENYSLGIVVSVLLKTLSCK